MRPRWRVARPRRAFTLLEVIVALAIFVGAAAVLSRLVLLGQEAAEFADLHSRALIVAESRWAEVQAGARALTAIDGEPVDELPGWTWSLAVETASVTALSKVTLRVEHPDFGDSHAVVLVRYWIDRASLTESEPTTGAGT